MTNSSKLGTNTSDVEVTNVSKHGLWILVAAKEYYLPYDEFPWFRKASIEEIIEVEQPMPGHFHWPLLDVDLGVESIEHPERYPLKARV